MNNETYYFTHDYNARFDSKIKKLIARHRYEGYGLWWAIVEDLYNNANALPLDYESIAFDLHVSPETIKSIVHDFDLFVVEGGTFKSLSAERRLLERKLKSEKARESALKRWSKENGDANAMRTHTEGNALKERKIKERKGNIKKGIAEPGSADAFKSCIELYDSFIFKQTGAKAKLDGASGKSLKTIISYFTANAPPQSENKDAEVINSFSHILNNFHVWEPFHQKQLKLTQINSNLINIISAIKKTTPTPVHKHSQAMSDAEYNTFMYGNPKGILG